MRLPSKKAREGQGADRAKAEGVQYPQAPQLAELPATGTGSNPVDTAAPRAEAGREFGAVSNMNFGTKTGGRSDGEKPTWLIRARKDCCHPGYGGNA